MNEWKIEDAIADLKTSHARTTKGVWGKGKTTHETVARSVDKPPYKIADFHHADDAQFVDLAHAIVPALIGRIEKMEKDAEFLNWCADRFVHVHGESENVDFVLKLRSIAAMQSAKESQ